MSYEPIEALASFWFAIAVFGFTGSLHCAGMCGPLAALTCRSQQPLRHMLWYYVSRSMAYAVLGGLAGLLGQLILKDALNIPGRVLAVVLGGLMVLYAVVECGLAIRAYTKGVPLRPASSYLKESPVLRGFLGLNHVSAWLQTHLKKLRLPEPIALGFLTAILPCGFLYAAVAQAVLIGNPGASAVAMLIFAWSTSPALMLGSWGAAYWQKKFPTYAGLISSVLLLLASFAVLYRGVAKPHDHSHHHGMEEQHEGEGDMEEHLHHHSED